MTDSDTLQRENETRQDRVCRLNEAILRIGDSLDLNTVLQEAVVSARALTGARYGVITTVDEDKRVQDFVTSGFRAGAKIISVFVTWVRWCSSIWALSCRV